MTMTPHTHSHQDETLAVPGWDPLITARTLANELADSSRQLDANGGRPEAQIRALCDSGLLGLTVPTGYGGPGGSVETLTEVIRLLAYGDPAIAQIPQSHFGLVELLRSHGTDAQRDFIFGEILAGRLFGNAQAERGIRHGDPIRTRLSYGSDGKLRLRGKKSYCTGAYMATWIRVSALNERDEMVWVLVERGTQGVEVLDDWNAMGQRATGSGTTLLNDAEVSPELVLTVRPDSPNIRLLGTSFQIMHAAIDVGIGARALEEAATYVRERSRAYYDAIERGWEKASDEPQVLHEFGSLAARQHAAEALLERAARQMDHAIGSGADNDIAVASAMVAEAKAFGGQVAIDIGSELFSLAGASATDMSHGLDRHWRNVRTHTLHDPARWKYYHAGNFLLNGVAPPSHGQS